MAQRTVCLCDGKYIGIETIYTVIEGRQINIPEKVKALRERSRKNKLFCPCGCGSNLILVAGDKNEREQHFRIKDGSSVAECSAITEGRTSINSKIVLKCWLDEKLKTADLESRVPIHAVDDTNRKYEFTFLTKERKLALSYCHDRANLSDEKIGILEGNSQGIRIIYVVDCVNGGCRGQYPEGLMKIQNRQRYCLLLGENTPSGYAALTDADYDKAILRAVFYAQDIDGLWAEVLFAEGPLKQFSIYEDGSLRFMGQPLTALMMKIEDKFLRKNAARQLQRDREAIRREEAQRRFREKEEKNRERAEQKRMQEAEKHREEIEAARKKLKDLERKRNYREELAKRRMAEFEEKQQEEFRRQKAEAEKREANFICNMEESFSQQVTPVRDAEGNRWIKCEYCGKIAKEGNFLSYGGRGHVNLGTCKECARRK
ncbi:MAG: DNA topoisomerase I [Lachnospiraceae bacterium]|nr:DNA topoisomerase I [Lachnospiraceae bacterium]